jgi:hypothetical protein
MIRRREIDARVSASVACYSFRATGIKVYLENKGTLETAQKIAAQESPHTTNLYDRVDDPLTVEIPLVLLSLFAVKLSLPWQTIYLIMRG